MTVVAEFGAPAAGFPLGRLLETLPEATVRLDRVVPTDDGVIPYVWVDADDDRALRTALEDDPDVREFRTAASAEGETLVRIEWNAEVDALLAVFDTVEATLLSGTGRDDRWRLQVRFPDHDRVATFHRRCEDRGVELTLRRILDSGASGNDAPVDGLTDAQRETLLTALEKGYFEVPRRTTHVELADHLDVSDVAVSQRLRRGMGTLVRSAFGVDPD